MLLMLATAATVVILLLAVAALRPARSTLSPFELRRRKAAGDRSATAALRREDLLAHIDVLRQPLAALLLVALTLLLIAALGRLWGAVASALAALFYTRAAGMTLLHKQALRLYQAHEKAVLGATDRHKKKLGFLTGMLPPEPRAGLGSREELIHLITESGAVLSSDDKKLLTHALAFGQRCAADIMTARQDIVSVEHTELLGPLVLSDLHETGHSCFPVIVGDLDHIVGLLDIRDHLTLEAKRSLTAAKTMTPRVFYIRGDQTLDYALAAFVRTRHHLLVVVDETGATLGLLSLKDVLEELFGRPMADEFASDSDVRSVATRDI